MCRWKIIAKILVLGGFLLSLVILHYNTKKSLVSLTVEAATLQPTPPRPSILANISFLVSYTHVSYYMSILLRQICQNKKNKSRCNFVDTLTNIVKEAFSCSHNLYFIRVLNPGHSQTLMNTELYLCSWRFVTKLQTLFTVEIFDFCKCCVKQNQPLCICRSMHF